MYKYEDGCGAPDHGPHGWCNIHNLLLFSFDQPHSPYVYVEGCGAPDHGPHGWCNINNLLLFSFDQPPSPYVYVDKTGVVLQTMVLMGGEYLSFVII